MSLRKLVAVGVIVAWVTGFGMVTNSAADDEGSHGSGFFNALGGFLHREAQSQTNSTNRTIQSLKTLDSLLYNSGSTNADGTNTPSMLNRLGSLLGDNSSSGTNSAAGTNLVQKVKDWLETQQSGGNTNTPSTNSLAQKSWLTLTNWVATHLSTNTTGSATSQSGTNLTQKLKDWVGTELQIHTNENDSLKPKLAALANLLSITNQVPAGFSETNLAPAALTQQAGQSVQQEIDSHITTNQTRFNRRQRRNSRGSE